MVALTMMAVVSGLALQQRGSQNAATDDTSTEPMYCTLYQPGHPTVNFNPLGLSDQDYAVGSHLNDGYDYVINVCRDLNYNDEHCHEGSAVCRRHGHVATASEVYAYTGSTKLSWSDVDEGVYGQGSKVVMEMTGGVCATNGNKTSAKTTIDLICSQKEFLVLTQKENELCEISFTFYTAQACGAPRYSCDDGSKCIADTDYTGKFGTFEGCRAECGEEPKYACEADKLYGFACVESDKGNYTSYAQCSNNCTSTNV